MEEQVIFTPNLYITRNDGEIIDMLVDKGLFFKNLSSNQLVSFFNDEDFCLVLYFADDYDRGFQMFVIRDFCVHVDELIALSYTFKNLLKAGYNYKFFSEAKGKIDDAIYLAPTFRVMLNKPEEEDEY